MGAQRACDTTTRCASRSACQQPCVQPSAAPSLYVAILSVRPAAAAPPPPPSPPCHRPGWANSVAWWSTRTNVSRTNRPLLVRSLPSGVAGRAAPPGLLRLAHLPHVWPAPLPAAAHPLAGTSGRAAAPGAARPQRCRHARAPHPLGHRRNHGCEARPQPRLVAVARGWRPVAAKQNCGARTACRAVPCRAVPCPSLGARPSPALPALNCVCSVCRRHRPRLGPGHWGLRAAAGGARWTCERHGHHVR